MEISSKNNGMRVPSFLGGNKFRLWGNKILSSEGLIKMLTEFRCVEPIPLLFWY